MKMIKRVILACIALMIFGIHPIDMKAKEEKHVDIISTYVAQSRNLKMTYNPNERTFEWNADRYPGADYFDGAVSCRNIATGSVSTYAFNGYKGSVQTTLIKGVKYEITVIARYWSGNHILVNVEPYPYTRIITG